MLIQRIKVSNYKTYLDLDLDLTVDEERPIILIGGSNGGGKTTLFEAISGALYGLKIENRDHFMELVNQGAVGQVKPEISLQITFSGKVLGQEQKYILKRTYVLNPCRETTRKRQSEHERKYVRVRHYDCTQRAYKERAGGQQDYQG